MLGARVICMLGIWHEWRAAVWNARWESEIDYRPALGQVFGRWESLTKKGRFARSMANFHAHKFETYVNVRP